MANHISLWLLYAFQAMSLRRHSCYVAVIFIWRKRVALCHNGKCTYGQWLLQVMWMGMCNIYELISASARIPLLTGKGRPTRSPCRESMEYLSQILSSWKNGSSSKKKLPNGITGKLEGWVRNIGEILCYLISWGDSCTLCVLFLLQSQYEYRYTNGSLWNAIQWCSQYGSVL